MGTLNRRRIKGVINPTPASQLNYIDTMGEFIAAQRKKQQRRKEEKENSSNDDNQKPLNKKEHNSENSVND